MEILLAMYLISLIKGYYDRKYLKEQINSWMESSNEHFNSYMELARVLLNSENEVGVSDSSTEHGVSPHVRKMECEADVTDEHSNESEQITLGKRIDSGSICIYDNCGNVVAKGKTSLCQYHWDRMVANAKES